MSGANHFLELATDRQRLLKAFSLASVVNAWPLVARALDGAKVLQFAQLVKSRGLARAIAFGVSLMECLGQQRLDGVEVAGSVGRLGERRSRTAKELVGS